MTFYVIIYYHSIGHLCYAVGYKIHLFNIGRISVYAIGMFMPNITCYFHINLMQIQYNFICKGHISKGARGANGGGRVWAGFWGGSPENPSGVDSRPLVPPRGGWGAEKAAFSTV